MFRIDSSERQLPAARGEGKVKRPRRHMPAARHNRDSIFAERSLAAVGDPSSYREEINQRANKQTRVMEEILSHHCRRPFKESPER